jgi:arabinofuranan 3-O-arabinosyltransferase
VPATATLLRDGEAAAAREPGTRTAVEVTRWDAEQRGLRVDARSEPTLLVVPENVNPGWVATLDGGRLETRVVDGWQQGYLLPAGPAAEVRLEFEPGSTYRAALVAGAAGVVLLLAVLLVPARSAGAPAPERRRRDTRPSWLGVTAAVTAGMALVAGTVGLVALGSAVVLGWAAGRRRRLLLGAVATASLLAAGVAWLAEPPATAAVQALALVAAACVLASVVPGRAEPGRSGTRRRNRRSGRSITS